MAGEAQLSKLVSSALSSSKLAEEGDVAEEGRAVEALKLLAKTEVSAALLSKTEAGKLVKKLFKHPSKSISSTANTVIDAWKEAVRVEQAKKKHALATASTAGAGAREPLQLDKASSLEFGDAGPLSPPTQQGTLSLKPASSGDSTRDKIRGLLAEALAGGLSADVFGDPCALAVEVEDAMYQQNGGMSTKYKAKFRTLSFNLKDPNNPSLRVKVRSCIGGDGRMHACTHESTDWHHLLFHAWPWRQIE